MFDFYIVCFTRIIDDLFENLCFYYDFHVFMLVLLF